MLYESLIEGNVSQENLRIDIPDDDEIDIIEEETIDIRESLKIQIAIANIGAQMGYDICW